MKSIPILTFLASFTHRDIKGLGGESECTTSPLVPRVRDNVHILNLRYAGIVEDQVYATLSQRFGDIFSVLGQLPDGFEDQWIEAVLQDRQPSRISLNARRSTSGHL